MELWKILRIVAWLCLVGMVVDIAVAETFVLGYIFLAAFILLMIFSGIWKSKDPRVKRAKEERKAESQKQVMDSTPVAAELVRLREKTRGSAVIGAISGGIPGAIVCAHLGRGKATFAVRYASGRTDYETVVVDSARFKKLSALTE